MGERTRTDFVAGTFRQWPAALRRRLIDAVACGASQHRGRRKACGGVDSAEPLPLRPRTGGSERLDQLLKAEAANSVAEDAARRKIASLEELQRVVAQMQLDGGNAGGVSIMVAEAAAEVRRLAKDDPEARERLAVLGAITPLVGMLDSEETDHQITALYALLNLGIGNELNKASIVKAGTVHKMLHLIESASSQAISEAVVANFLGLSALDSNKPLIGASGAILFLLTAFQNPDTSPMARQDALRALFNLSIAFSNLPLLIDAGLVPALLASIGDMVVSERALAVLSNLVTYSEGRRAVSRSTDAFAILIDVLGWCDAAACQESAVYVLMVMAHKGRSDRAAMVDAGAVSALLELTLLGTPLSQKRASRLLKILTTRKGKGVPNAASSSAMSAVSAPLCGPAAPAAEGMSQARKSVKELVRQSLHSNMQTIVRRSNLAQDLAPSDLFNKLTATSTSKSLPF
ncbi:U-box domain-containing protein 45-like [Curcuma longa]|uniref:U-box domain-containing protein 45-like n=1 Tax=Curcuma longa TaxID=136217 RepID=UPI003D9E9E6F